MVFSNNMILGVSAQAADYLIEQSLRFNDDDSAYLNRTPSTAGNRKTWTFSCWVKLGSLPSIGPIFNAENGSDWSMLYFNSSYQLLFQTFQSATTTSLLQTNAVFRDTASWLHIVAQQETTSAVANDRHKLWVNGVEITSFATRTNPAQNLDTLINSTTEHRICRYSSSYADQLIALPILVDGAALTASDFGETDDNGYWNPIEYTGSYGTNGFVLDFSDTAAFGDDTSGNTNDYTANNFTAADQLPDVPTDDAGNGYGNFANWNGSTFAFLTSAGSAPDISDGGLVIDDAASDGAYKHPWTLPSSGKWAIKLTGSAGISTRHYGIGIMPANDPVASGGSCPLVCGNCNGHAYLSNGSKVDDAGTETTSWGSNWGTGADIEMVYDADTGTLTAYYDGVSQGNLVTGLSGDWSWFFIINNTTVFFTFDFGQSGYSPTDTGASLLATQNLTAPTIADPSQHFNTVLYTGDDVDGRAIDTGTGGDCLVWIKNRDVADWHVLHDPVRGAAKTLFSNATTAEQTNNATGYLSAFNGDGTFDVSAGATDDDNVNQLNENYVAWCWKANGAGSTNNDGSITSTVSANQTAGFSIVTYTGTGSTATVGHGLGTTPSFLIVKNRDNVQDWPVWTPDISTSQYLTLNENFAVSTPGTAVFSGAVLDSTTFILGTNGMTNTNNDNYVAYCWAEVEGFSKFGSYTANNDVDGPFIWCGFKPAFVLFKTTNTAGSWQIRDTARSTYNPMDDALFPNLSNAENTSSDDVDFLSNGFKLRSANNLNFSSDTLIFAAFAEQPFQGGTTESTQARAR